MVEVFSRQMRYPRTQLTQRIDALCPWNMWGQQVDEMLLIFLTWTIRAPRFTSD